MALTNAEKQARWRKRNNELAKIGREHKARDGYVTIQVSYEDLDLIANLTDDLAGYISDTHNNPDLITFSETGWDYYTYLVAALEKIGLIIPEPAETKP